MRCWSWAIRVPRPRGAGRAPGQGHRSPARGWPMRPVPGPKPCATLQVERLVQAGDRVFDAVGVDDAGDTDFRGRDHLDVDAEPRQRLEHVRGHPRLTAD